LVDRDVEPDDRNGGEAEAPGGNQALVPTNDDTVLLPREDRLYEAELPQAPFERVEFFLADPSRVRRIMTQLVDWDLLDDEGAGGAAHAAYHARSSSLNSGRVLKPAWGYQPPALGAHFREERPWRRPQDAPPRPGRSPRPVRPRSDRVLPAARVTPRR
jgi:hypothetical protein